MITESNEQINIFQQLEQCKEQNPDFAEALQIYREVMPVYRETTQIMREIELALHPYTIRLSSNTESAK